MKTEAQINEMIADLINQAQDKETPEKVVKNCRKRITYLSDIKKVIVSGVSEKSLNEQLSKLNELIENRNNVLVNYGDKKRKQSEAKFLGLDTMLLQKKNIEFILSK